jgi:multidrug transporter EmrE-like cation transporter
VAIKGFGAGSFSLILSLVTKSSFPGFQTIMLSLLLGAISYGVGIAFFVLALRSLGAARTGALYSTAPFVGAALSLILFREQLAFQFFLSLPLMVLGVILLLTEHHEHAHWHPVIEHEHLHTHNDLHHMHEHTKGMAVSEAQHSHPHRHESINHSHPHTPDLHHWHDHGPDSNN